jgi:uncharacterized membrane-anchored protein
LDRPNTTNAAKVPEVTLVFWIIKIAATTLGETGGDTVTMTLNWGYLLGTALFLSLLVIFAALQIAAKRFHPWLYWATIVASTTAGTTMADFADRSLGIGYAGGSTVLFVCLMTTLGLWYRTMGSISVATVSTPRVEIFYWVAITFSQTLGTALGDWLSDGVGYEHGVFVFGGALAVIALAYYATNISCIAVLGRIHPDAAAGRHRRRFSRQAGERRWPEFQPADRERNHRRLYRPVHFGPAATRRTSSRTVRGGVALR